MNIPTEAEYKRIIDAVRFVEQNKQKLLRATAVQLRAWDELAGGSSDSFGVITAWSVLADVSGVAYRWLYDVTPAWVDGGAVVARPEAVAEQRYNIKEFPNVEQHTGTQGNSVYQGGDYPANFLLVPVGGGSGGVPSVQVPVRTFNIPVSDGSILPAFDVLNADDGTCSA